MRYLAPIVEGHGEEAALPALLHRIARATNALSVLRINAPIRAKSGSFVNDENYFHRYVSLAAAKARQQVGGGVLILLDCDDDCPATLGPHLLDRARAASPDVDVFVALAYREFETWFVTAARSLRGNSGLPDELEPPPQTDGLRNAKGWLGSRMPSGYDPIIHQLEFVRKFDLDQARRNSSFDRLYRFVTRFIEG